MNKKTLALVLSLVMIAVAVIGGTMAYFTDKDEKTNTFTCGNVDIEIREEFNANAKLYPGVNVPKKTFIDLKENSEDAYVWFEYLVPHALNAQNGPNKYYSNDVDPALHVDICGPWCYNFGYHSDSWWRDYYTVGIGADPIAGDEFLWDYDPAHNATNINYPEGVGKIGSVPENNDYGYIGQETIGDIVYDKYVGLYLGVLSNKTDGQKETSQSLAGVYFSDNVDHNGEAYTFKGTVIDNFPANINVIVRAYAIQAEGFDNVYDAYNAYQAK